LSFAALAEDNKHHLVVERNDQLGINRGDNAVEPLRNTGKVGFLGGESGGPLGNKAIADTLGVGDDLTFIAEKRGNGEAPAKGEPPSSPVVEAREPARRGAPGIGTFGGGCNRTSRDILNVRAEALSVRIVSVPFSRDKGE
jgi:hypothetical protein